MTDATANLSILVKVQDEASAALRRISNDVSDMGGSLNFASIKAGVLAGAMAAIAGAAIMSSIKAFADSEVQMAKFDAIMKTLPPDLQVYRDRILQTANAAIKLGFDNETAAVSIARLFQATGDAEFAFKAFQAAMDLARYKGISLEDATNALIMAFQGGGRLLKQFGIDVDDHASKETILAAVFQKVQGQAVAYADTIKGSVEVLQQYQNEVQEAMGQPFGDFIRMVKDEVIGWVEAQGGINALLNQFSFLMPYIGALLVGVLGAGLIVAIAAALALIGPFGLIVAVLMALGGVMVLFVAVWKTQWENIKEFTGGIIEAIKAVWQGLVDWVQNNIIKWFEDKIDWVSTQLEKLKSWAREAWSTISSIPSSIKGGVMNVIGSKQTGGYISETGPYLLHRGEYVVPSNLAGAGAGGGINVFLQGDFFTDSELAKKFGDLLAKEIKYQLKL